MGRRRQKVDQATPDEPGAPDRMLPLVDIAGLVLIALRWFTPTEGSFRGDTLWISQLWLGWGALAAWSALRQRARWKRGGGLWTPGLVLLVIGHVVSGLAVVATEGQKRAALNGLWEWVSLGVAGLWFHHRASSGDFRRTFRIAVIASAVGLSALGIWQRWVTHPALGRMVIEFDELEAKLPELEGLERSDAQRRLRRLSDEIGPEYVSLSADGRRAMRQRLLESSEPLGRFALANSLAALLLVGLMLVTGEALQQWLASRQAPDQVGGARGVFFLAFLTLLIAFVLLLSKSRTAWAGGLAGGAAAALIGSRGRMKTVLTGGMVALATIGVLVIITWAAGGLDKPVVTQAFKSLEYRMEYWVGALHVIQEHPWLGIGPGNFRQHYLKHKVAKSSEEVLDPHNFLLDAWTSAGLAGIAGLFALIGAGLRVCRRPLIAEAVGTNWRSSAPAVLLGAAVLLALVGWRLEGIADWELAAVACVAVIGAIALNRVVSVSADSPGARAETATLAAWFALSIHLLGAGGMEMPAIIQLWLCLSSLVVAPRSPAAGSEWPSWSAGGALTLCALALVGQARTATAPWLTARSMMNLAQADSAWGMRFEEVDRRLREAAEADSFDPEPWRQRSQLALREWMRTRDDDDFQQAVASQQEAIARDPLHAHDYRTLADLHLRRFAFDHRTEDAAAAVDASRKALELYPNHLASRRLLAVALQAAGRPEEAAEAARHAIELDALWLELGHYDKVLTPTERQDLQDLADGRK